MLYFSLKSYTVSLEDLINLLHLFNESVVGRRTYPTRGCGISRFGSIPKFYQLMIKSVGKQKMRPDIRPDILPDIRIQFKLSQLL